MVSLDDLKNLIIYKKQFYLPINEKNKKKNSLIMLLTPNYKSSANMMTLPYTKNLKYFESYYMEKNVFLYTKSTNEHVCVIPEADYSDEPISITESYEDGKYLNKPYINYTGDSRSIFFIKKILKVSEVVDTFKQYESSRFVLYGLNVVCGDTAGINVNDNILYLPSIQKYNAMDYDLNYEKFVKVMLHEYIINTLNPKVNTNISFPIAIVMADVYKDIDIIKYSTLVAIQNIRDNDGGFRPTLYRAVQNNDYYQFIATLMKNGGKTTSNANDFKNSYSKFMPRFTIMKEDSVDLITEDEEVQNTPITSLDDLKNVKTLDFKKDLRSLKRKLKQHSVYKLNKIKKDVRRGNTGTDKEGMTSLEKLQSGNIVSNTAPAAPSAGKSLA